MRLLAAVLLAVVALPLLAYGLVVWTSIPTSDSATSALLLLGLPFVGGAVALLLVAARLARRR